MQTKCVAMRLKYFLVFLIFCVTLPVLVLVRLGERLRRSPQLLRPRARTRDGIVIMYMKRYAFAVNNVFILMPPSFHCYVRFYFFVKTLEKQEGVVNGNND